MCHQIRIIYGTRISLTVGLLGIIFSFIIGITIGGLAGYYGVSVMNSIPEGARNNPIISELPLWMALIGFTPRNVEPYFNLLWYNYYSGEC